MRLVPRFLTSLLVVHGYTGSNRGAGKIVVFFWAHQVCTNVLTPYPLTDGALVIVPGGGQLYKTALKYRRWAPSDLSLPPELVTVAGSSTTGEGVLSGT